ncbi:MAG: tRNA-dihydrouridine synthase family protein [bacterium]|nr:tRNA-dihydrouridine synthase family protein [bacterium]
MRDHRLPFTGPALLAPMEGVTEPCFRDLVLQRNAPTALGGAFTEFARVVTHPLPARNLATHLGPERFAAPVGLQLMGQREDALAETARVAESIGAPVVDLNFGCPAKGALRTCAGAALLDEPRRIERVVRSCVQAVRTIPITAKIRAGGRDDARLEEIARAVEAGGARMLTVHCRTREEGYRGDGDWTRLRRAVAAVRIPVCGNGGINTHVDLRRMFVETGCAYAMVGRAALADPWIFSGRTVDRAEAADFLLEYARSLASRMRAKRVTVAGRLKRLIRTWSAGGLFLSDRTWWLEQRELEPLLERLCGVAIGIGGQPVAGRPDGCRAETAVLGLKTGEM